MDRLVTSGTCPFCDSYMTVWWTRESPDAAPVLVRRACQGGCTEEMRVAAEAVLGM